MMTEEERMGLKQSEAFFNFASSPHGCCISSRTPHCANCWSPSDPRRPSLSRALRSPPPTTTICLCISWSCSSGSRHHVNGARSDYSSSCHGWKFGVRSEATG